MEKKEAFEKAKKKTNMTKDEMENLYQEMIVKAREYDVPETEIEKHAVQMFILRIKKQLLSKAEKYEGVRIGTDHRNWNNERIRYIIEDSLLRFKENKSDAINGDYTNSDGKPLWHKTELYDTIYDWEKGVISEENLEKVDVFLVRKEGEKDFRLGFLTLRGEKRNLYVKKGIKVGFLATGKITDEGTYKLYATNETKYDILDDKEVNFPLFTKNIMKENVIDLMELETWYNKNPDDKNRVMITRGAVFDLRPSKGNSSHLIQIDADSSNLDGKPINCWLDKNEELDFDELALEIYVIGKVRQKVTDTGDVIYNINALGFWVPKEWRRIHTENITTEKIVEKFEGVDIEVDGKKEEFSSEKEDYSVEDW